MIPRDPFEAMNRLFEESFVRPRFEFFTTARTFPLDIYESEDKQQYMVEATYEHGILTLHIPKAEGAKPKQIPVKVKEAAGKR